MNHTRRDFIKTTGLGIASGMLSTDAMSSENRVSTKRPNILLFLPDQHRFDWIGTTPHIPVRTPALDALALRGARFTRAVCPSPLCAPSRACLAAGKEYDNCRVASNGVDYPLDQPTFYTMLRESGYNVMGCGKFDLHKASQTWGLEGKHLLPEWGFSDGIDNAGKWDAINSGKDAPKDPYMAYLHDSGLVDVHVKDFQSRRKEGKSAAFATPLPDRAYCDNWIGQNGLNLLDNAKTDQSWFMQVNFTGPHDPWDITHSMKQLYQDINFNQPNRNTQFTARQHNEVRRNYSAMVENIDRWLSVYIDQIKKRGEWENTLIVYSSDHGEMLGDHNMWGKSKPHQPSIGIPLTIAGPGVKHGIISDALVSLMDLTATFLNYADLPVPQNMDSRSLIPVLTGAQTKHRDILKSGLNNWRTVFDGQYKLVEGYGKTKEPLLFDMLYDPLENNNIAGKAEKHLKRMREMLA